MQKWTGRIAESLRKAVPPRMDGDAYVSRRDPAGSGGLVLQQ